MAGQTTALTEFSDNGDSRTYSLVGHTVLKPQIVVQKRRVPSGNQVMSEISVAVIIATDNAASETLTQKVNFSTTVRYPITGTQADIDAALVIFRDIIAGDEFANAVDTQEYLA